jgi:hypothetical protein
VDASATIECYTEKQIGTWQSLLKLDVKSEDFTLDTLIQSAVAETSKRDKASERAINQNDADNKHIVNN